MPAALKVLCPAKVNLFLEITGRRPDGYHRIATLFAKINLYDVLELELDKPGRLSLEIEGEEGLAADESNLVWRAARDVIKTFGVTEAGVKMRLVKRIPMGAGLGGGSSDAAGALRGLAQLLELPKAAATRKELLRLARGLGADVPFFMHPASFCLGAGVGDRLSPVVSKKALPYMILAWPGFPVSTAEVYRNLQLPSKKARLTTLSYLDKLVKGLEKGRPFETWEACLFNRLEQVAVPALSRVEQTRRILSQAGVQGVRMTGSGSAVFGFVSSHAAGEEAVKTLQKYPWRVFLTCCNA